jgi:hypothetical protein
MTSFLDPPWKRKENRRLSSKRALFQMKVSADSSIFVDMLIY